MDGAQHVQGYLGYGPIPNKSQPEPTPPNPVTGKKGPSPWPEEWEGPMTAIYASACTVLGMKPQPQNNNLDMGRWGRETMQPRNYSNSSYFELWLRSVSRWLQRGGLATNKELTGKTFRYPTAIIDEQSLQTSAQLEQVAKTEYVLGFGAPVDYRTIGGVLYPIYQSADYQAELPNNGKPLPVSKFKVGDKVRGSLTHGATHNREYPIYRGRVGEVVTDYGLAFPIRDPATMSVVFQPYYQSPYPDISSKGFQEFLVPIYSVRFKAEDLFGASFVERMPSNPTTETYVYVDMWEPYIEPLT